MAKRRARKKRKIKLRKMTHDYTATTLEIGMATDVIAEPHFVKREQLDSIL